MLAVRGRVLFPDPVSSHVIHVRIFFTLWKAAVLLKQVQHNAICGHNIQQVPVFTVI